MKLSAVRHWPPRYRGTPEYEDEPDPDKCPACDSTLEHGVCPECDTVYCYRCDDEVPLGESVRVETRAFRYSPYTTIRLCPACSAIPRCACGRPVERDGLCFYCNKERGAA